MNFLLVVPKLLISGSAGVLLEYKFLGSAPGGLGICILGLISLRWSAPEDHSTVCVYLASQHKHQDGAELKLTWGAQKSLLSMTFIPRIAQQTHT